MNLNEFLDQSIASNHFNRAKKTQNAFQSIHERKQLILFDQNAASGKQKLKTNVHRQINKVQTELTAYQKPIILLKTWKKLTNQPLSSYAIELMADAARKSGPAKGHSPADCLRHLLRYAIAKLPYFTLHDLGMGTPWDNYLNHSQQQQLRAQFKTLLKALDPHHPDLDTLRRYFPINPEYPQTQSNRGSRYGNSSYA